VKGLPGPLEVYELTGAIPVRSAHHAVARDGGPRRAALDALTVLRVAC
jgi:hypothetical protein